MCTKILHQHNSQMKNFIDRPFDCHIIPTAEPDNKNTISTKKITISTKKLTLEEEVCEWLCQKSSSLGSNDISILRNYFDKNNFYVVTEKKSISEHFLEIKKNNDLDNFLVLFEIYDSYVFVQIDLGIIQFSQYPINSYDLQFFRYRHQWLCHKLYRRDNSTYIYQMCKKIFPKFCACCQKYTFELSPEYTLNNCINCYIENNDDNDDDDEYLEVNPDTINIRKNNNEIKNKYNFVKFSYDKSTTDNNLSTDDNLTTDDNLKFYSLYPDIEEHYHECKKDIEGKKHVFSGKKSVGHFKRKILSEAHKQKIHFSIDDEKIYIYQIYNNLFWIMFYRGDIINYYCHKYDPPYHYITYKKNDKMIIYVIDDPQKSQNFGLPDFSSLKINDIFSGSFNCCNVSDSNISVKYFHYYENTNNKIYHRKIIYEKKNNVANIIFDAGLIKDNKSTIAAGCDDPLCEPDNLTVYKNIYHIHDDKLFTRKIICSFKFFQTLKITTKTTDKKNIYMFDNSFNLVKKKVIHVNKELYIQLFLYIKNRIFILYYENDGSYSYKHNLPTRGYLEFDNFKYDIYDCRMNIYYQNHLMFAVDYKSNMTFFDGTKRLSNDDKKNLFQSYLLQWPNLKNDYDNMMQIFQNADHCHRYDQDNPIHDLSAQVITSNLVTIENKSNQILRFKYVCHDDETRFNLLEMGLFHRVKKIIIEKAQDLNIISSSTKEYKPNGFQKKINDDKQNNVVTTVAKLTQDDSFCQIGYKACKTSNNIKCIVKLGIYFTSNVVYSARYDKYRTDKAYVIDILDGNGNIFKPKVYTAYPFIYDRGSFIGHNFQYNLHESVNVSDFNDNVNDDCGKGIHYHNDMQDVKRWFSYSLKDLYTEVHSEVSIGGDRYNKTEYVPIFHLENFEYVVDGKKYNNLYTESKQINQKKIQKNKLIYLIREYLLQKNIYFPYVVMYIYEKIKKLAPLMGLIKNQEIITEMDKLFETDEVLSNLLTTDTFDMSNRDDILQPDIQYYLEELDQAANTNLIITEVTDEIPLNNDNTQISNENNIQTGNENDNIINDYEPIDYNDFTIVSNHSNGTWYDNNFNIMSSDNNFNIMPSDNNFNIMSSDNNFNIMPSVNDAYSSEQYEIDYLSQLEQALIDSQSQSFNNNQLQSINHKDPETKNEEIDDSYPKSNIEDIQKDNICIVCFDNISQKYVLVPCGHTKICGNCIPRLINCPICRKRIGQYIRFYD